MKYITFATAGHIDHGKSTLIKIMTGKETDTLKEEKERGITINLGYAGMEADEYTFSFVDVPGHERLVKNMISGVSGADAALIAVDCREGIKQQTIEHVNILEYTGVKNIVAAITKTDILDFSAALLSAI